MLMHLQPHVPSPVREQCARAGKLVRFANPLLKSLRFSVSGTVANPEGITNPPIDELLEKTTSKYALVIFAAKRARQVNAYYSQLGEGLLEYVGPLVETTPQEKPLSIAMREINAGLLTAERIEEQ
jgi:DNA-directed RNA polymerase subunit omega